MDIFFGFSPKGILLTACPPLASFNFNSPNSAFPDRSSGALGPFVGKVTQSFLNDIQFINRVELCNGILKVELNAGREVLDSSRIRVNFKETTLYVFGKEVARKEANEVGVWKYEFGGAVTNGEEGDELFLCVLKTPSAFVIAQ